MGGHNVLIVKLKKKRKFKVPFLPCSELPKFYFSKKWEGLGCLNFGFTEVYIQPNYVHMVWYCLTRMRFGEFKIQKFQS